MESWFISLPQAAKICCTFWLSGRQTGHLPRQPLCRLDRTALISYGHSSALDMPPMKHINSLLGTPRLHLHYHQAALTTVPHDTRFMIPIQTGTGAAATGHRSSTKPQERRKHVIPTGNTNLIKSVKELQEQQQAGHVNPPLFTPVLSLKTHPV